MKGLDVVDTWTTLKLKHLGYVTKLCFLAQNVMINNSLIIGILTTGQ